MPDQDLFSQVPLKALYEEFTSSTCGPCRIANEILDPILEANEETNTVVKYQVDWPGDGDPYFIPQITSRVDYYEVTGAPTLITNGQENDNLFDYNQSYYDAYTTGVSFMKIDIVNAEIDADNLVELSINISALDNYEAGLRAHVMITEGTTFSNVESNGELEFFDVVMQMLPSETGTILPAMSAGDEVPLNLSFDMDDSFMETPNDLKVIVFVQDDSNKRIIQSENKEIHGTFVTHTIKMNVYDSDGNEVNNAKIFLEDHGFAYTDNQGAFTYEDSFDGTYEYVVSYPGLRDAEGVIVKDGSDITETIIMEVPDYYYYEDFGLGLPNGWATIYGNNDAVYWYEDRVILFRQATTFDPVHLVSPVFEVDNIKGGEIIFSIGEQSGDPEMGFGTQVGTLSSAVELATYMPPEEWTDFSYDLSTIAFDSENVKFYWNIKNDHFSFFALRYVIITKGEISSINQTDLKNVRVYPNPVSNQLHIEMNNGIDEVSIFNMRGQLVLKKSSSSNHEQVDISSLLPGLYSILISNEYGSVMKNIVVE